MNIEVTKRFGWPLVILLSAVPLILWGMMYALPDRFGGGVSRIMTSLGQALGLVGLAMFSLNFVLGARWKWIEHLFGGMNRVYIAHHILGGLAFVLLLLHPMALVLRYVLQGAGDIAVKLYLWPAGCSVEGFLQMSQNCAVHYGLFALGLMIVTLFVTFFAKLPYHIWKWTHKFLGLAFFLGALHALTIPSDVAIDQGLKWYMWFLVGIGLLGILYRTLLGWLVVPRLTYTVKEVRQQSPAIIEIVMEPKKKPMRYKPGQFLFINFPDHQGLEEVHPFSITSAPEDPNLSIGIKALGDYTKVLLGVKPGDKARIEGPFGRTSYVYVPNHSQVWIAGGIGITPFLGMARALKADDPYHIDLYYSLVDRNETAFVAELQAIAAAKANFRFFPHYAKEVGFLTAEVVKKGSGLLSEKNIILCGPPPMMKGLKKQFADMHLNPRTIYSEEFSLN
jgi:predicted ferric reductase